MAVYRNIHISFWKDPKVMDRMTPLEKLFFLWLITNSQTNICGCYEISIGQSIAELKIDGNTEEEKRTEFMRLLHKFRDVLKIIDFDDDTNEIFVINWHKYNWTTSERLIKAIKAELTNIKSNRLYGRMTATLALHGIKLSPRENVQDIPIQTEITQTTPPNNAIMLYNEFIEIVKTECPELYRALQAEIDGGRIGRITDIEDALNVLQMSREEYQTLFAHVRKTYIIQPKYIKQCGVVWVLNHISEVQAIDTNKSENVLSDYVLTERDKQNIAAVEANIIYITDED